MSAVRVWLRAAWDRLLGFALIAVGATLALAGYVGLSGTRRIPEEVSYLTSGAVGGLFLLVCGATLVLSADMRDQLRKLRRLEPLVVADEVVLPPEPTATRPAEPDAANGDVPLLPPVLDPIARPSRMRTRT
jgi:hypothetical protein